MAANDLLIDDSGALFLGGGDALQISDGAGDDCCCGISCANCGTLPETVTLTLAEFEDRAGVGGNCTNCDSMNGYTFTLNMDSASSIVCGWTGGENTGLEACFYSLGFMFLGNEWTVSATITLTYITPPDIWRLAVNVQFSEIGGGNPGQYRFLLDEQPTCPLLSSPVEVPFDGYGAFHHPTHHCDVVSGTKVTITL